MPIVYGSNTLTVTATTPAGATATQSVNVTGLAPSLTISSPAQGSVINAITTAVTGTFQGPANTTVTINGIAATVTGNTFSATVPVNYGSNTLTATAVTPNQLTATTSVTVTGSVQPLVISSPLDGATINANSVTVSGSFAEPTGTTVMVNGVAATVTGSNFTATVPLTFGSNKLTVISTASNGTTATATATVNSSVPTLQITSPTDGATINGDAALVTGIFQGPPNSGVTVNGVVASVDGGRFYANNVPLVSGANTITAIYTTQAGLTGSQVINVRSAGINPIQVTAEPSQGVAPLIVSLSVQSQTGNPLLSISADPGGNGSVDAITPNGSSATIQLTYPSPGTYLATVTVTDSLGDHNQIVAITVLDPVQMDQMFGAIWDGTNNALVAGDKARAMSYLNSQAQAKYGPVFDALLPTMPQIIASYSPLQRVTISQEIGEYAVNRVIDGVNQIFLVYLLRGEDGVWLLDSM